MTLSRLAEDGFTKDKKFPPLHGHSVTVPGAAAAWVDTVSSFGSGKVSYISFSIDTVVSMYLLQLY